MLKENQTITKILQQKQSAKGKETPELTYAHTQQKS